MKSNLKSALLLCTALATPISSALAQASPAAFTTGYRFDGDRRLVGTIAPDPDGTGPLHYSAVRNTYDAAGRLTKVERGELASWQSESVAPSAWTGFTVLQIVDTTYDALDRKALEVQADGSDSPQTATQYSYDGLGRLECTAVRMNPAVFGSLSTSPCVLGTQGSNGPDRITKNIYDAAGQLLQVREGVGTSIEAAKATYSYTQNGQKEYVIDGNGNRARFVYDGFDRLSQWQFPSTTRASNYDDTTQANALSTAGSVNTTDYEQYAYDNNDNRTSYRKRDGYTLTYSYDALNRLTVKFVPDGGGLVADHTRDVYYGYDLLGHMTYARFDSASGDGISNVYDGFGELASETNSFSGVSRTLSYTYDTDGNRTRITHPDGVYFTLGSDDLDRMNSASWTTSAGTTQFMSIAFEASGRRSNINRASSWTAYGYDSIGRLAWNPQLFAGSVGNVTQTFSYSPASQISTESRDNDAFAYAGGYNVNRNYTTNGLNQYSTAGSASFTYDANGNLTSDGTNTYVYDRENRLAWASGPTTTALYYDPLGRLRRTVAGTSSAVDTWFLYDADRLVAESAGSNPALITKRYFFGPNSDEVILEDSGGALNCSGTKFLHTDHEGSIVALADCWGNRTAVNTYDEYGIPGSANIGRFQYTGQMWMPEVGMYFYKARMYSPTLGRFMQTDPIGYKDQMNLYEYVGDDPVDKTDPQGTYEASGAAAQAAAQGIEEIKKARDYYASPETGSRIARSTSAAAALNKILKTLGTKGDGGVRITTGDSHEAERGHFDGFNTITLDVRTITNTGHQIGDTLAHEAQHYRQRFDNLNPLAEEVRPLAIQAIVGHTPGGSIKSISGHDYVRQRLLSDYCHGPAFDCNPAVNKVMRDELSKPF